MKKILLALPLLHLRYSLQLDATKQMVQDFVPIKHLKRKIRVRSALNQ
jgi:hypothetical protein